jgi:hypothetical protein
MRGGRLLRQAKLEFVQRGGLFCFRPGVAGHHQLAAAGAGSYTSSI